MAEDKVPEDASHFHALMDDVVDKRLTRLIAMREKRMGRRLTQSEIHEIAHRVCAKGSTP